MIWHTQGSGKSLTMLMLAGALIREPRLTNPTVVMITDRNDLDDQLFDTFAAGRALLRQAPVQADEPGASEGSCSTARRAAWCSPPSRSSPRRTA